MAECQKLKMVNYAFIYKYMTMMMMMMMTMMTMMKLLIVRCAEKPEA